MKKIPWAEKRTTFLQVLAFAMFVVALQFAFMPGRAYGPPLVHTLFIATLTWAIIDIGRHLFPSSEETGWPQGGLGILLVVIGIVTGYVLGSAIAERLGAALGWQAVDAGSRDTLIRSSILITILAGIAASYYFYSKNKSLYLERKMAEISRQAAEARLRLLESQLEPHMLFNTLANLRALIATDPPRATAMLDRMIAYLRATLSASRTSSHTLQAEFERLHDYLELMTIRMGSRLRYTLDLPAELASLTVPALLLQPLVENSIQHGLEPKVDGGSISVRAERAGATLTLVVSDTGLGCTTATTTNTASSGFGLTQVRERLLSTYGPQASLALATPPAGGTMVTLSLPAV